jgi:antitoxin HicB
MELNDNIDETELIDETDTVEEFDSATAEAEITGDRPQPRGRRGRRLFGPNRPYRFALFVEDDGTYVLRSPDLAERTAQVTSLDEIGAAMQAAIEYRAAEDAAATAEAEKDAEYSGKFVLRLPRSMHRQLVELAEAEGVSLNQLALTFLAQGMGRMDAVQEFAERRVRRGGPHGGHSRHGGRGPGGRGPWGPGPEGRERHQGHGREGRDFSRGPWSERGPEHRFGGRFGRGMRRGRRPEFTGHKAETPVDPRDAQFV